jgi:phosphatidylserine decarboxylase
VSILPTIKEVLFVPIHPKGKPIIAGVVILALILCIFSDTLGNLAILFSCFTVYFFRNPDRLVPQGDGFVLATGDGVITAITPSTLPKELGIEVEEPYVRISIFLNVFNVHVNRVPATGVITREVYIPGAFFNAALDKASEENERSVAAMKTDGGEIIGFSQIAGLIAKRIVCQLDEGERMTQGTRYGIIRFGSRCDVYVPARYQLMVAVGSVAVGGETIVAVDPATFDPAYLVWQKN